MDNCIGTKSRFLFHRFMTQICKIMPCFDFHNDDNSLFMTMMLKGIHKALSIIHSPTSLHFQFATLL
jgi:hypothetical protein